MIRVSAQLQRQAFGFDVDVRFAERVTAIFGPSGAGKSTLLKIIAGITRPETGLVEINQQCLFDSTQNIDCPIHQRGIGLVFQDARLFPHLSVEKNLRYGLKYEVQNNHMTFQRVVDLLEIKPLLQQPPHQLSGGEKQRVALGRALLSAPRLLMLDEPLASLDHRLKNQILPFLKLVADEIEIPMLYISHSIDEITQITQHVVYMENGRIIR